MTFSTFVLWLHLAGIAIWAGGLFVIPFVVVPGLLGEADPQSHRAQLATTLIRRFQSLSWRLVLYIVLTGIFNLMASGVSRGFAFPDAYLHTLFGKVGLFATVVAIQAWQSYHLAPALMTDAASSAARLHYRRFLLTSILNWILVTVTMLLALVLKYGR